METLNTDKFSRIFDTEKGKGNGAITHKGKSD